MRPAAALLVALVLTGAACRDVERPAVVGDQAVTPSEPITAERLRALLETLPGDRAPGRPGHAAARAWLLERLDGLGLRPELAEVAWAGAAEHSLQNVELTLPAADDGAPILVLGAHYDSVAGTPGADDNGSGVVALLELARRLSGPPPGPLEVRCVWFDAEEPGLIGSGAFVAALDADARRRFLGAVVLETMAYVDRRPGSQAVPPGLRAIFDPGDTGDFLLVVGNVASAPLAQRLHAALAEAPRAVLRAEVFSLLPGAGWVLPDARRSDHARFWDAGLPAVMLTDTADFRSPHYHRASDRVETLDLDFLAEATAGVERAVLRLAADLSSP